MLRGFAFYPETRTIGGMRFTGVHHCSIIVSDMPRAIRFYREILGIQQIAAPQSLPDAGLDVRWFQVGDEQIHLIPAPAPDAPGQRHFALHVDDAVEIRETIPIPGADRFFIRDPDGNRIELIQWKQPFPVVPVQE
jgi:catechol 2,3-dioxygenase-like lactoylglutathione lyase family enzyme